MVRCFFFIIFFGRAETGLDWVLSLSRPLSKSVLGLSESTLGEWSQHCRLLSMTLALPLSAIELPQAEIEQLQVK